MSSQDKCSQQGGQANRQAGGPQEKMGPGEADAAGRKQQAGGALHPARFSQQVAQKIPSDPDPDDPVSP